MVKDTIFILFWLEARAAFKVGLIDMCSVLLNNKNTFSDSHRALEQAADFLTDNGASKILDK